MKYTNLVVSDKFTCFHFFNLDFESDGILGAFDKYKYTISVLLASVVSIWSFHTKTLVFKLMSYYLKFNPLQDV